MVRRGIALILLSSGVAMTPALADDGALRLGPRDVPQSVRLDVVRTPDTVRFCENQETTADGCVLRRSVEDAVEELPDSARREDARRRAAARPAEGARLVIIEGRDSRPPVFSVETRGAPTIVEITPRRGGAGRVSLRSGETPASDGTDPSPESIAAGASPVAHRDLFSESREASPPALAVDVTLAPSGSLFVAQ